MERERRRCEGVEKRHAKVDAGQVVKRSKLRGR